MLTSADLHVDVVVELVVAGEGEQHSEAGAQREEDLSGGVDPHLDVTSHTVRHAAVPSDNT